jgi:hypothetical protein
LTRALTVISWSDTFQRELTTDIPPGWAPDRDVLYYARGRQGEGTIMAATYATDGGFHVMSRDSLFTADELVPDRGIDWDVIPDGQEFLYIRSGGAGRELVWILNWPEILREIAGSP